MTPNYITLVDIFLLSLIAEWAHRMSVVDTEISTESHRSQKPRNDDHESNAMCGISVQPTYRHHFRLRCMKTVHSNWRAWECCTLLFAAARVNQVLESPRVIWNSEDKYGCETLTIAISALQLVAVAGTDYWRACGTEEDWSAASNRLLGWELKVPVFLLRFGQFGSWAGYGLARQRKVCNCMWCLLLVSLLVAPSLTVSRSESSRDPDNVHTCSNKIVLHG